MVREESNPFKRFINKNSIEKEVSLEASDEQTVRKNFQVAQFEVTLSNLQRRLTRVVEKEVQELKAEVNTLKEEAQKTKDETDIIKKENSNAQAKQLEITALIVALFTFVSLQLQIVANISKVFFVPLSLLTLGGLLFFVAMLSLVNATRLYENRRTYVTVTGTFAVVGCVMVFLSWCEYNTALINQDNCRAIQAQVIQRGLTDEDMKGILDGDKGTSMKIIEMKKALNYANCEIK